MKKKLLDTLEWMGIIIALLFIYAIDTILLKTEIFIACCVLMGDVVICVTVISICEEICKSIIKFSRKRWRKSENGL